MSGFGCNQRLWWRENPSNLLAGAATTGRVCYGLELDPEVRRCDRETLARLHGEEGDA